MFFFLHAARTTRLVLLMLGMLGLGLFEARLTAQAANDPVAELVAALRKDCASNAKLRGVLLKAAESKADKGKLELAGTVDTAEQRKLLEEVAATMLQNNKAWAEALPGKVSAAKLDVFPINSKYLKRIQNSFARRSGKDDKSQALRRSRLDEAVFMPVKDVAGKEIDTLILRGAALDDGKGNPRSELVSGFREAFKSLPELSAHQALVSSLPISASEVRLVAREDWPINRLQGRANNDVSLDGCVFLDNWYDGDGTLQVRGIVPDEAGLKRAEALLQAVETDYPAAFRSATPRSSVKEVKVVRPPLTVAGLQAQLARSRTEGGKNDPDPILRRIRLDRWFFAYDPKTPSALQLRLTGVSLAEDFQKRAFDFLREACNTTWPALRADYGAPSTVVSIERAAPQPGSLLQEQIAALPELDGVGLDNSAFFDEQGRLCLRGVWRQRRDAEAAKAAPPTNQEAELRRVTDAFFRTRSEYFKAEPKPRPLTRDDVVFQLEELRTDEVLRGLRQWMADTLEDSFIERLYFDKDGRLAISGFLVDQSEKIKRSIPMKQLLEDKKYTEKDITNLIQSNFEQMKSSVRDELLKLLKTHPQMRGRFTVEDLTPAFGTLAWSDRPRNPNPTAVVVVTTSLLTMTAQQPQGPTIDLVARPGLTPYLRQQVQWPPRRVGGAAPTKWDGVQLRRGYFNADGKYSITGLMDNDQQQKALEAELSQLAQQEQWRRTLASGWDLTPLKTMPLAPMLDRLKLVLPTRREFDGITVTGAAHDWDNRLLLRSQIISPNPQREPDRLKQAEEELTRQLRRHDLWRERAATGVRFVTTAEPKRASPREADYMLGKARGALAQALADSYSVSPKCGLLPMPLEKAEAVNEPLAEALRCLDAAILNDPNNSTSWFARSLVYQARGDTLNSDRDLRRMAEIEQNEGARDQRMRRLHWLEPFQGETRRKQAESLLRIRKQLMSNQPPLEMADPN